MLDYIKENYVIMGYVFIGVLIIISYMNNLYSGMNSKKSQTFSINKKSQIENYTNDFQNIYSKDFDMKSPLEWTYYYVDNNKYAFSEIESELQNMGYHNFHTLNNNGNEPYFFGFQKEEVHTPTSLVNKNIELEKLGNNYGIQYDGFEFGNINKQNLGELD